MRLYVIACMLLIYGAQLQAQDTVTADCALGTASLSGLTATAPAGTMLTWHMATPATLANKISDVTALAPGTYYAAFEDASGGAGMECYSGATTAVQVVPCVNNTCPATTYDLTGLTATGPAGTTVSWHTATPATSGNKVVDPTAVVAGTYYAAFEDASGGMGMECYSGDGGDGTATTAVVVEIEACDTDGDGDPDSTDPNPTDPCVYSASQVYANSTQVFKDADCDGDGVTNGDELDPDGDGSVGGTGPNGSATDPTNPCSVNLGDVSQNATSTGDCDGDGVTDADEINGTDGDFNTPGDNTDPNDGCKYNSVDQVVANVSVAWEALDCDGDNVTNEDELDPDGDGTPGPDGTDPQDPDTDGDGNPDGTDSNPVTPTAVDDSGSGDAGVAATIDILSNDDYLPNNDLNNEGVTSITDAGTGTAGGTIVLDPVDGTLDYTPLPGEAGTTVTVDYTVCNDESGAAVCETATVTFMVNDPDTDGDGDPDSTDPNPTDPCVYSASQVYANSTQVFKDADCDGDGVTNGDELDPDGDGSVGGTGPNGSATDPTNPCSVNLGDVSQNATSTGDCDGDGVTDADEINGTDGDFNTPGDNTDPNDGCKYNSVDQVVANVSVAWEALDCDGDNVTNEDELDPDGDGTPGPDGTDPQDPDTDGDGNPDGTDSNPVTPTAVDDSGSGDAGVAATIDILSNDDYLPNNDLNNEGVTSISDAGTGTAGGTIVLDPVDGTLDYTPLPGEAGTTVTVDYTVCNDESGVAVCETATVTFMVNAGGIPDLIPVIIVSNSSLATGASSPVTYGITNIGTAVTNAGITEVGIVLLKPDPSIGTLTIDVAPAGWTVLDLGPIFRISSTTKDVIVGFGNGIEFTGTFTSTSTVQGSQELTATVVGGSGGEVNTSNNSRSANILVN